MLVENGDEGFERAVQHLVDPRRTCASAARRFVLELSGLHCSDDVSDADLCGRPRQHHASVPSTDGIDQTSARQDMHELEDVLHRDVKSSRYVRHLHERPVRLGAIDEDAYGMSGRFIQSHDLSATRILVLSLAARYGPWAADGSPMAVMLASNRA